MKHRKKFQQCRLIVKLSKLVLMNTNMENCWVPVHWVCSGRGQLLRYFNLDFFTEQGAGLDGLKILLSILQVCA